MIPPKTHKPTKILRKALLALAGLLLLPVIVAVIISLPDQLRSIPAPKDPMSRFYEDGTAMSRDASLEKDKKVPKTRKADSLDSDSPSTTAIRPLFVMPDISNWTPEEQALALDFKKGVEAKLKPWQVSPETTRNMPFEEALEECKSVPQELYTFCSGFRNRAPELPREKWAMLSDAVFNDTLSNDRSVESLRCAICGIALEHQRWSCLADLYSPLAGPHYANRDYEVYYRQKDGLSGRVILVLECVMRTSAFKSLFGSPLGPEQP